MQKNQTLQKLEDALKELSLYEKKGFDASSLKIFIKNFKDYLKITGQSDLTQAAIEDISYDEKLLIIKDFLEDKKVFPSIRDVIEFSNTKLKLDFKDQKESRDLTISRILLRIKNKPELKELLKSAVISIRNEKVHNVKPKTKKDIISAETFSKWAEIIKNI